MAQFENDDTDAYLFSGAFAPGSNRQADDVRGTTVKNPEQPLASVPQDGDWTAALDAEDPSFPAVGEAAGAVHAGEVRVRANKKAVPVHDEAPVAASGSMGPKAPRPGVGVSAMASRGADPGETAMFIAMASGRPASSPAPKSADPGETAMFMAMASVKPATAPSSAATKPAGPAAKPIARKTSGSVAGSAAAKPVGNLGETAAFMAMAGVKPGPALAIPPAPTAAPTARPTIAAPVPAAPPVTPSAPEAPSVSAPAGMEPASTAYRNATARGRRAVKRQAKAQTKAAKQAAASGGAPVGPAAGGRPPRKPGRIRNIISTALIVAGVLLLAAAGFLFVRTQLDYKEAQGLYKSLVKYAPVSDADGSGVPTVDWDGLKAINSDVVGWIYVPGTNINYPVVQGKDNSTYLNKLYDGTANASGSIFMDMEDTAPGVVDQQTTLYGHHMNDSSMFNVIDTTTDQDVFDTIETVYYLTPDATYTFKPLLSAKVEDTYNNARVPNFLGDTTVSGYLSDLLSQAGAKASDASARVEEPGKLLTLVTCADGIAPSTSRVVMVCTLVG